MKLYTCNYDINAFLAKLGRCPVWAILIFCLVLLHISYVVKNHFRWWPIIVFGFAGILAGGAGTGYALLNQDKTSGMHDVRVEKSLPQITSGWDYRPRGVIRRAALVTPDMVAETTYDCGISPRPPGENADVWFNFANPEPTLEKSTIEAPLPDNVCKASTYD